MFLLSCETKILKAIGMIVSPEYGFQKHYLSDETLLLQIASLLRVTELMQLVKTKGNMSA